MKRCLGALCALVLVAGCEPAAEMPLAEPPADADPNLSFPGQTVPPAFASELTQLMYSYSDFADGPMMSVPMVGPDELCVDIRPCIRASETPDGDWNVILSPGNSLISWTETHEDNRTVTRFQNMLGNKSVLNFEHGGLARILLTGDALIAFIPKAATDEDVTSAGYEVALHISPYDMAAVARMGPGRDPLEDVLPVVRSEYSRLLAEQSDRSLRIVDAVRACASAAANSGLILCKGLIGEQAIDPPGSCALEVALAQLRETCPVNIDLENGWISLPARNAMELSDDWLSDISRLRTERWTIRGFEGADIPMPALYDIRQMFRAQ